MTLRVRLAAVMASAVFLAFLVAAGASFIATANVLDEGLRAELAQTAAFVAENPGSFRFSQSLGGGIEDSITETGTSVELFNLDGRRASATRPALGAPLTAEEAVVVGNPALGSIETEVVVDGQRYQLVTRGITAGAVRAARSTAAIEADLASLRADLIRFGIVAAGIAAGIGAAIANRITRPVTRLTEVAEDIAETGNLDRQIDTDRIDEVGRLARAFNRMVSALSISREQQHRLVMDASHELRTPLTSLRTNVEVLRNRGDRLAPGQRDELLDDVRAEVIELSDLVGELVDLATDQRTAEVAERLRLDDLAEAAAERTRRRHGRPVETALTPCEVVGRPVMLDRAVGNLLENAHKWSPTDAAIRMTLADGVLTVHDRGPGIAPEDRAKVFDRFYRSIEAQNLPGSGLGLAIVKQTVEAHGGTVFVEDSPDGGAAVGFRLPGVRAMPDPSARSGRVPARLLRRGDG